MKKRMVAIFVAVGLRLAVGWALSSTEMALYHDLTLAKPDKTTAAAVDKVLKSADNYSTTILLVASEAALNAKRLEDAGFLFFIGEFRMMFDKVLFPPTETVGNNQMSDVLALRSKVGRRMNPSVRAEPKVYARVVERLKSWKPEASAEYEPGWEYSKRDDVGEASRAMATVQKQMVEFMGVESGLLLEVKYSSALKVVQGFQNNAGTTNQPTKKTYEDALQTMEQMEKDAGIRGMAYIVRQLDARKKALQDKQDGVGKK